MKHVPSMRAMAVAIAALGMTLSAGSALAQVKPAPVVQPGYVVPRTPDGHPDLQGVWTNATLTRLERPANYGDRLILTDEEMRAQEKDNAARNQRQNAPTSKEVLENWAKPGAAATGPDTADECRSGARGTACGYNAGWTDPGDWVMRVNGKGRTSMITYPANGRMPARVAGSSAGRARVVVSSEESRGGGQGANPEERSLGERCIISFGISSGPVMTPQLYNNTYQFIQTPDNFAIWVEMVHDTRIVRMNAKHRTDGLRPYMGDQIGWWDGDTLVVETTGYHPRQNVRGGGPNMKVTERFTRVAADRIHYAFDVQDPETWVEPWGGEYEFAAAKDHVYEYACHEGNYGLHGILSGARAEDRRAEAAAKAKGKPKKK